MALTQIALHVLTWKLVIATLLPFVNSSYWIFRVFEYPRFQKWLLTIAVLLLWLPFFKNDVVDLVAMAVLLCAAAYLGYKIFPYTPLARKEMATARADSGGRRLSVFSANVLQDNPRKQDFLALIRRQDPDIIFLVETDHEWQRALASLEKDYPFHLASPQENTYGLLFYSRIPMVSGAIKFLVEPDIPSLDVQLQLAPGEIIQLWGLHPKPPVPHEDLSSTAKDKELMRIAFNARSCPWPVIVVGDLNDVAWSHTTELFRKTSGLLDPRRGRGFYSTFNALHWYMRFPLDYIFASTHFTLCRMVRLAPTGSDHFPILTELQYNAAEKQKQEAPRADSDDMQAAAEKLKGE